MTDSSTRAEQPLAARRLEVVSLGSGSSGNAFLVRTGAATLLVDCGVGVRRLTQALAMHGQRLTDIDAILISHEHSDHVRELPRFAPLGTPVHSTVGTGQSGLLHRPPELLRMGRPTQVRDIEVVPVPISHDAREPCGFLLRAPEGIVTVLTDLGCAEPAAAEAIAESDLVVIEANHDPELLRRGPYPRHLQRRILSDIGHLSNDDCAALLTKALRHSGRLPTIWLAHLSATNNRPSLAVRTVERGLVRSGLHLEVAALPRQEIGPTWSASRRPRAHAQLLLDLS